MTALWGLCDIAVKEPLAEDCKSEQVFQFIRDRYPHPIRRHLRFTVLVASSKTSILAYDDQLTDSKAAEWATGAGATYTLIAVVNFSPRAFVRTFATTVPRFVVAKLAAYLFV